MRVVELWRYPVKSLQGECIEHSAVGTHGLTGDRRWGIADVTAGLVLTARRAPELLFGGARLDPSDNGRALVELPDGSTAADDGALSAWLGRAVELREATPEAHGAYETPLGVPADDQDENELPWVEWHGPTGSFHDSTRTMVSIVSSGTMAGWDRRRFRANVVVDAGAGDEDALVGSTVTIGTATLEVVKQIDRCVMTTRPQPGGIERDLDVLRTINRERGGFLAVGALVASPGRIAVGDEVIAAR